MSSVPLSRKPGNTDVHTRGSYAVTFLALLESLKEDFINYYAATPVEAEMCADSPVVVRERCALN